jgi:transposase
MRELDYEKVTKAKWLYDLGVPIAKIAKKFGVSRTTIYVWLSKVNNKPLT